MMESMKKMKEIGEDDPRRIVHSINVGLALTLVSLLYYCSQDLHNLIAGNIEKLAAFLEGFEGEFCTSQEDKSNMVSSKDDKVKSYLQCYKSVLNSGGTEESLANFAWWVPGHGGFRFYHPWKQYLNIGVLATECAYHIEALSQCMNSNPQASERRY
ncbi:hypothetical protein CDL12_28288 [Handroanthus impetiginosus]|uniref:Aluminum-activated malate transporter n=1 Tax=Handroanthus impetiginosus TaxID=429701 RepID=A0A2G9G1N0_9LAMI|nr:hypothetical protein CDL12_28288 [Handroanthus impetiginosus]